MTSLIKNLRKSRFNLAISFVVGSGGRADSERKNLGSLRSSFPHGRRVQIVKNKDAPVSHKIQSGSREESETTVL
jgi:hypothetical protein